MAPAPTLYGKGQLPRESGRSSFGTLHGGELCLDFINTTGSHQGAGGYDHFAPGYVNIIDWFEHAGVVDADQARRLLLRAGKEPREAAAVRKRATMLRTALFEIVAALTTGAKPPAEPMTLFNEEFHLALASGHYVPRETALEWQWISMTALDRVLWEVSRSAASLLSSRRLTKVRQCAAPSCERYFLDISKNGSRQYCSASGCGTAERVRRFRERQQAAS